MDWRRLSRLCFLGLLVMIVWMLVPAGKCAWTWMDEAQLGSIEDDEPSQADAERVGEGQGFLEGFFGSIGGCYERHPLSAQRVWKRDVATALGAGWVFFWVIAYLTRPRYRGG